MVIKMNRSSLIDRLIAHYIEDVGHILDPQLLYICASIVDPVDRAYAILDFRCELVDTHRYNACIQLQGLIKKYVGNAAFANVSDADRANRAIDTFVLANQHCADVNSRLRSTSVLSESSLNYLLSEASALLDGWLSRVGLSSPNMALIASDLRPGPGASVGAPSSDFYSKFAEANNSVSSEGLFKFYSSILSQDGVALAAEQLRFTKTQSNYVVSDSRISTVPKSYIIDRTICIEPSVNMLFQLSTGKLLERVLRSLGICLSEQPDINRQLAFEGSLDSSYSTIDLRSASDTVSLALCERLLPRAWYQWLLMIRSPSTTIRGESVELNMMSTMGNGFTFPLQTLLFTALVHASYNLLGVKTHDRNHRLRYGVFGDDIVVVRNVFGLVCKNLTECGFLLNEDKTFHSGSFRESCGHDWLSGISVRPVYVSKLDTMQDRVSLVNRLIRWSTRTKILIPRTVGLLIHSIPKERINYVPFYESDDAGIKCTLGAYKRTELYSDLNRSSILFRKLGCNIGNIIYRIDKVRSSTRSFWYWKRKSLIERADINWHAVYLGILGGYVRGTGVMVRPRTLTYKSGVFVACPGWTATIDPSQFSGWRPKVVDWESTSDFYMFNM